MQRERSTSSDDDNPTLTPHKRHRGGARPRVVYSKSYKLQVVREALTKDPRARIKPTCHNHPGVGPAQLRKWIKKKDTLEVQARLERQVLKCRDDREYLRTVALTGLETRGGGGGGVSEPQAAPLPSRRAAAAVTPQKLGAHSCMPVALATTAAAPSASAPWHVVQAFPYPMMPSPQLAPVHAPLLAPTRAAWMMPQMAARPTPSDMLEQIIMPYPLHHQLELPDPADEIPLAAAVVEYPFPSQLPAVRA
ncbi:hypothetical protein EMIHUDRAFT_443205 [Emiliania huxleyi CCMP1516]|uniref:Uncharacterized protein n=2 Tax=Emiliania huxleyi TaxID=2903 RepID=A0A0D3JV64_EMIH1|nr:hypothetical protein EMIHUDRAFT_444511 [Emiliania huxleyi CCMP1516]XP_005779828.1 hypothetical protein EMIHUDRAFT_443205 [Emiliania huxleyi CCMP1516]EOD21304.1 hypothetical protein EMIHUDRAFT_444511 [Emiliania huxleyi CCMP1516]EOD27399.1 hypothetical protein EMIHUDRAFT_443205 [Emiliania huxleyi CCMP1516]|eukprot:XP_005773733.1 hypothetical protein EMIHUDRAFT_444511 [Emiliania huxleyi CCMP1516]